jgi:hypothetical protein
MPVQGDEIGLKKQGRVYILTVTADDARIVALYHVLKDLTSSEMISKYI